MAQIREIKKRMQAVKTIQRITKTMQMIATAKFTTAQQRARATKPYTERMAGLVAEALGASAGYSHPLIDGPGQSVKRQRVLVITSDRGLCGAYNGNVLRSGLKMIRDLRERGTAIDLETSGKKAVGYFRFQKLDITQKHLVGDKPSYDDVARIGDRFIEEFVEGKFDAISVVYMEFISSSRQASRQLQLLPLEPAEHESTGAEALSEFSPSTESILDELLPMAVKANLYQAFLDAVVSEQLMRMVAMRAATDNAGDLAKLLNRDFNRARQSKITTELMEVISGAAALE